MSLSSPQILPIDTKLAVDGGIPVRTTPLPARRLFGLEEKEAACNLFDKAIEEGSHILGYNGSQETAYCQEFADFLGGGFADGVNSGTNAVFVALRALEIEPFSEVIVPPVSDPGGVMPVALCNLIPVPTDAAPGFFNTSVEEIEKRLTERTRAILIAHVSGLPVDMEPVMELAKKHNLSVIEDCAQAHGTVCRGRMAGTFGHIAAFSTMFGKQHASAGQGGIVFTRDEDLYWRVRRHADRGKPFGVSLGGGAGAGVGGAAGGGANAVAALNFNMDELHACIGRVQLKKLPAMIARRREIAARLVAGCEACEGVKPVGDPPFGKSSYWFQFIGFDPSAYRVGKADFIAALNAEGMSFNEGYGFFPSRMLWAKNKQVFGNSQLPWSGLPGTADLQDYPLENAMAANATHFTLHFHEEWTDADTDDAIAVLQKVDQAFRHSPR